MIIALLIFTLVLSAFGLWIGSFFSRDQTPRAFIFLAAPVWGFAGFMFTANALGYLIPIHTAFRVVLLGATITSLLVFVRLRPYRWWQTIKNTVTNHRTIFLLALTISLISGVMAIRALAYDDLKLELLPTAKTLLAGNFPVMNAMAPDFPLAYHYGTSVLAAALTYFSGLPLYLGYDFLTTIFSGLTLLIWYFFLLDITGSIRAARWGAAIGVLGGSLSWINGATCVAALFKKFAFEVPVDGPFACGYYVLHGPLATPLFGFFHQHGVILSAPLILVALWYLHIIGLRARTLGLTLRAAGLWTLTIAAASLLQAPYAMTLIAGLMGATAIAPPLRKWFPVATASALAGLAIAYVQGGVLANSGSLGLLITANTRVWEVVTWWGRDSLFHWNLFIEFLALVLFLAIAIRFTLRSPWRNALLPFVIAGAISFLPPILLRYEPRVATSIRDAVLYDAARFWSFGMWYLLPIVGLELAHFSASRVAWIKKISMGAGAALVVTSLFWPLVYIPLYPIAESGVETARPFIGAPRPLPLPLQDAATWIQNHTANNVRIYTEKSTPEWILATGRMFPTAVWRTQFFPHHVETLRAIAERCDADALTFQKINYLLAVGAPAWESHCDTRAISLVAKDDMGSWRIYRVTAAKEWR